MCDCNVKTPINKTIDKNNDNQHDENIQDVDLTSDAETCKSDNFSALFNVSCFNKPISCKKINKCVNKTLCKKVNKCIEKTLCEKVDKCVDLTLCDKIDACLLKTRCKNKFVWSPPCFTENVPKLLQDKINSVGIKLTDFFNMIRQIILSALQTGNFTQLSQILTNTPNIKAFIIRSADGLVIFSF